MAKSNPGEKPAFTNAKRVRELVELMRENELIEIELVEDKSKITLKRANPHRERAEGVANHGAAASPGPVIAPHAVGPATTGASPRPPADETENLVAIKSPMVGTFYTRPTPDSEAYVGIGAVISDDSVVCIIEAMKVFNEIKAETAGTIAKVLVQNGQPVEYNQTLFLVKPA